MSTKTVSISLPEELLEEIDGLACSEKRTRSELLRLAVIQYLADRRWERIRDAGSEAALRLGLTDDDVEQTVHEYRRSQHDE